MENNLKIGGVYKTEWDDRPFRIIGLDSIEVFYDCFWPHSNSWTFSSNLNKKCYFYRAPVNLFEAKSVLIDYIPLSESEQFVFRPDLLLRICRSRKFNWNGFRKINYYEFKEEFEKTSDPDLLKQTLLTDKIVLFPSGNKGGLKKGIVIIADNLMHFEHFELIWKARNIQEAVNKQMSKGIGLYRIGIDKGLPSYYIGEYFDKAGLIKE